MKWHKEKPRRFHEAPDLASQYEQLLDTVWRCERDARFLDKIELGERLEQFTRQSCGGRFGNG
jgi:hypothetical protein